MKLPEHIIQWAKQTIETKAEPQDSLEKTANRHMVSELHEYELWLQPDTLCALEILAGNVPLDTKYHEGLLQQQSLQLLEEVVEKGGKFHSNSVAGFDMQQVANAVNLCPTPTVQLSAKHIHAANQIALSLNVAGAPAALAGSLLRIVATHPSKRLERRQHELEALARRGIKGQEIKKMAKPLQTAFGNSYQVTEPLVSQLQSVGEVQKPIKIASPAAPAATSHAPQAKEGSWGWIVFVAIILAVNIIPALTRSNKTRQPPAFQNSAPTFDEWKNFTSDDLDKLKKLQEIIDSKNQSPLKNRSTPPSVRPPFGNKNPVMPPNLRSPFGSN